MPITQEKIPSKTSVGNYFISNYPPFSSWKADGVDEFQRALNQPPDEQTPLGLYVHLPFCRQRCHHCCVPIYPRRKPADVDAYIEAVLKELSLYLTYPALKDRSFSSVYFGGGSPSYLLPDEIRRLLTGLQNRADWDDVHECTFECEPGTITWPKMQALKESGATRVTIGFQSLTDSVLRQNGRDIKAQDCLRAFHMARAAGFDEINIDLVAGLRGETTSTWMKTVEQVLELAPDCVTIYQFELPSSSMLNESTNVGRDSSLPSWNIKRQWVDEAFKVFEETGYTIGNGYTAIRDPKKWRFVYTVEHFWHGADLLGLGETAFGHLNGVHYQNADKLAAYLGALAKKQLPVHRACRLSDEEKLRREVIFRLKSGVLDVAYFQKKFSVNLAEHFSRQFAALKKNNLLEMDCNQIRLTREGLLQVDWLLPRFYLPEHAGIRHG